MSTSETEPKAQAHGLQLSDGFSPATGSVTKGQSALLVEVIVLVVVPVTLQPTVGMQVVDVHEVVVVAAALVVTVQYSAQIVAVSLMLHDGSVGVDPSSSPPPPPSSPPLQPPASRHMQLRPRQLVHVGPVQLQNNPVQLHPRPVQPLHPEPLQAQFNPKQEQPGPVQPVQCSPLQPLLPLETTQSDPTQLLQCSPLQAP